MKKIMAGLAAIMLLVGLIGAPASAADLSFSVGNTVKRGKPGDVIRVGGKFVPADLVGRTCEVSFRSNNSPQPSVHPGNDVIVLSGQSRVQFANIENQAGPKVYPAKKITLGEVMQVQFRFGTDGVTSTGFALAVDCPPPPTTVPPTTEPPTTTEPPVTTVPPTTEPPTTVTTVPPKEHPPVVLIPPAVELPPAQPAPPVKKQPTFTG